MTNQMVVSTSTLYDQLIESLGEIKVNNPVRVKAMDAFKKNGFPTNKNEYWRFTNLKPFLNDSFVVVNDSVASLDAQDVKNSIEEGEIADLDAYKLVVINGSISEELSVLPQIEGLTIKSLMEISNDAAYWDKINNRLDIEDPMNSLAALNTALFSDGFYIEAAKNVIVDKPIHVFNIYGYSENVFIQPRNMVVVNKGANVEIVETYTCVGDKIYFINSVSDLFVDSNGSLVHSIFQNGKNSERVINHTQVTQQKDSHYANYIYSIPQTALIRNNLNVELEGSNIETHMYGLYLAGKDQLIDNHSLVDHLYPHCESNQLYKGVLIEGGKAVFNGRIYVHEDAQKTNAYQSNNNMLFSNDSVIHSKPQLEIYADDVKCSHGTTIGQYDSEALFYLRARALSEQQARALLVTAFANDVTSKIPNEALRNHVEEKVSSVIANANVAV
ncbi:MAG: Fe-S cluster assembly protein SufD [Pseudopedobacter saltans]|uniref:Fe-S cluster assembly protein SufD n=1 Tax=Pseudopedobacter saltans TaxID=151895 RepID=A0A2W5EIC0_9SPHI|nr:MAG: Fe-S cluster assembly protein SufD [Pseudopedobacter saltans]